MEVIAKMLCEIAGFEFPYPNVSTDQGFELEVPLAVPQMNTSAVGDVTPLSYPSTAGSSKDPLVLTHVARDSTV